MSLARWFFATSLSILEELVLHTTYLLLIYAGEVSVKEIFVIDARSGRRAEEVALVLAQCVLFAVRVRFQPDFRYGHFIRLLDDHVSAT